MLIESQMIEENDVVSVVSGRAGCIVSIRRKRPVMIEVRWIDGEVDWLHPEQLRVPAKLPVPTQVVTVAAKLPAKPLTMEDWKRLNSQRRNTRDRDWLADRLVSLSDNRKNRTTMKAKKFINQFNRNIVPTNAPKQNLHLTQRDIYNGMSKRGGFTRKQLASWGVPWPPPKGWRKALETGKPIPKK